MGPFIIAAIIIFLLLIVAPIIWWIKTSNNFKRLDIKVTESLSGIEVALTKRFDMLTKLFDVAKGFAKHEKELFTEVINLRKGMTTPELNSANERLDSMSSRIFAVAESYPELRSSENFKELQSGVRDAEEHLQAARRFYNSNVSHYNSSIIVFPSSIVANSMNLTAKEFFKAEESKLADVDLKF